MILITRDLRFNRKYYLFNLIIFDKYSLAALYLDFSTFSNLVCFFIEVFLVKLNLPEIYFNPHMFNYILLNRLRI